MANDRIVSSPEAFEAAIDKFTSAKQSAQNAYLQITSAVFALDGSWDGEASEAFKTQYGELATNLQSSDGTIDSAIADIRMVITDRENTQKEVSDIIKTTQDTTDPFVQGG